MIPQKAFATRPARESSRWSPVSSRTPNSGSRFLNLICVSPDDCFAAMEMQKQGEMLAEILNGSSPFARRHAKELVGTAMASPRLFLSTQQRARAVGWRLLPLEPWWAAME